MPSIVMALVRLVDWERPLVGAVEEASIHSSPQAVTQVQVPEAEAEELPGTHDQMHSELLVLLMMVHGHSSAAPSVVEALVQRMLEHHICTDHTRHRLEHLKGEGEESIVQALEELMKVVVAVRVV